MMNAPNLKILILFQALCFALLTNNAKALSSGGGGGQGVPKERKKRKKICGFLGGNF